MAAKSFDNENKPNPCMSSWAESEARSRSFFERIARKEPKNTSCLAGISKRIWVAYQKNVTFLWQATETRYEIPQTALRFALSPRSSLGESSTPLRMTSWQNIWLLSLETKTVNSISLCRKMKMKNWRCMIFLRGTTCNQAEFVI